MDGQRSWMVMDGLERNLGREDVQTLEPSWLMTFRSGPHAELRAEGNAAAGPLPRLMLSFVQRYAEPGLNIVLEHCFMTPCGTEN